MEVFDGQQVFHPRLHPVLRHSALALRAMPIATRVIGDVLMVAVGAGGNMPTERGGPAIFDGRHHFELRQVQVPDMVPAIGSTMGAENIRDLQLWARHSIGVSPNRPYGSPADQAG